MTVTEQKKALRRELIARRRDILADVKKARDESIFKQLIPVLEQCSGVFTYVSTDIEVDTRRLIDWCFEHNKPVYTPVSGDSELTFFQLCGWDGLNPGKFGIDEPTDRSCTASGDARSLCIVPALCCDRNGFRLGYGRGYYDRFLSGFPGKSVVLCYSDFVSEVPREAHDRCADMVITDT
ncbi:MAG: 5-formyltetrahydrofolate cyclo-ligase [Oscillospiraceae bacterium]